RHCLVVQPNSGYGPDNRCLLDAIARSRGRFKGIAVVANDAGLGELRDLQAQGIIGIAFNATYHGTEHYQDIGPLLTRMSALGLLAQVQVEGDQLVELLPLLDRSDAAIVIDHCGRPDMTQRLDAPGRRALHRLARREHSAIKLSGHYKFSREPFPHRDVWPVIHDLVAHFGFDRCVWGSDWPFLRAKERIDYGPLLQLVDLLYPNADDRRKLLWDTPCRLFGFSPETLR
ncbi:MAG: amidohydrolase family protein, partial [Proteobacteria bacterium]|nr:amidohydrolase family protein [Pseudomonadota bacterium]